MISSFVVSVGLLILNRNGMQFSTHISLLITIAVTTVCWVVTAFVGPETDRRTLIEFYKKVRPSGPGWRKIRQEAGISEAQGRATQDNIPLALLGWVAGCTVIWSSLFTVGNFLYGRLDYAIGLFAMVIVSGLALLYVVHRLWTVDMVQERK